MQENIEKVFYQQKYSEKEDLSIPKKNHST